MGLPLPIDRPAECLSWSKLIIQAFVLFPRYNQASETSIIALISSINISASGEQILILEELMVRGSQW